ncbi:MAG: hypothetical protein ABEH81_14660 [Halopenitus sp.]
MDEVVPASAVELVELVAWALGAGLFSITGIRLEEFAIGAVTAGQFTMAAWYLGVGCIALYVGTYMMGYKELLPRVRNRGAAHEDSA